VFRQSIGIGFHSKYHSNQSKHLASQGCVHEEIQTNSDFLDKIEYLLDIHVHICYNRQ
jgi:hypothetical protein